jgi:hypothetical protein
MPIPNCKKCNQETDQMYMTTPVCLVCQKSICIFCSFKEKEPVFNDSCKGHCYTSSTRNRFMEDSRFIKEGGFDLESE